MDIITDNETIASLENTLTSLDRCDTCSAQAYVQVFLLEGDLLFCAHHYRKNESALTRIAVSVTNEIHKLEKKPFDPNADAI
jgi:hypothetical protein